LDDDSRRPCSSGVYNDPERNFMGDKKKSSYVEAATFDAWAEADIARCRLVAQGIDAVLLGPNTSSTLGMYMGAASKVTVMVPAGEVELARKILSE
jgi:hypothetical protein